MTVHVLLVGSTGHLGGRIAHHLVRNPDARVRLLVRDSEGGSHSKRKAIDELRAAGAEIVQGDVADISSLRTATQGIDVVVSALQGGPDVLVEGQVALANAAKQNGVKRIFPSDFAIDLFKAPKGQHPLLEMRREADERIAKIGIDAVHVLNGAFMDILLAPFFEVFNAKEGVVQSWGMGSETFDVTSIDDTARFTALAALNPNIPAGKLAVRGDMVSFGDIAKAVEKKIGRSVRFESRGPIAALEAKLSAALHAGQVAMAEVPALYQLYMLKGVASLDTPQNGLFPGFVAQTYSEFLASANDAQALGLARQDEPGSRAKTSHAASRSLESEA